MSFHVDAYLNDFNVPDDNNGNFIGYEGPDGRLYQCPTMHEALEDEDAWALAADPDNYEPSCRRTGYSTPSYRGVDFPYNPRDMYRIPGSVNARDSILPIHGRNK